MNQQWKKIQRLKLRKNEGGCICTVFEDRF